MADVLSGIFKGVGSLAGGVGSVLKPPSSDLFGGLTSGAKHASTTMQDIMKSHNPVHSTLTALNQFVSQHNTPADHLKPQDPEYKDHHDDEFLEQVDFAPVKLPSGLSLFGLLSMDGKEALDLVQKSNPDFKVLKVSESISENGVY